MAYTVCCPFFFFSSSFKDTVCVPGSTVEVKKLPTKEYIYIYANIYPQYV